MDNVLQELNKINTKLMSLRDNNMLREQYPEMYANKLQLLNNQKDSLKSQLIDLRKAQ